MTGTPTSKGPEDAYGLAKLVNNANGESFLNYKQRVLMQVTQFKWVPRVGASAEAAKMLTPAIRFDIDEVKKYNWFPDCTKQQRTCELSAKQKVALKALKQEAVLAMENGSLVHAVNEAALRMKIIQAGAGAIYDTTHASHDLDPFPRIELVKEIIDECAQKVIVAAPLTNVLNMLYQKLSRDPKGPSVARADEIPREASQGAAQGYNVELVNGTVSAKDRAEIFRRFGDPRDPLRVLLVDPGTVSHGINDLVSASVVIWYAPTDRSEQYDQLNKRIDRPGQRSATTIIQIVGTKLEEEIYERLDKQQALQGLVLQFARDGA